MNETQKSIVNMLKKYFEICDQFASLFVKNPTQLLWEDIILLLI